MAKTYTETEMKLERQNASLVSNFMNMRDEFIRGNRAGGYIWACDWALCSWVLRLRMMNMVLRKLDDNGSAGFMLWVGTALFF